MVGWGNGLASNCASTSTGVSLNGALRFGQLAAEAVLAALGLASEKRRPTER